MISHHYRFQTFAAEFRRVEVPGEVQTTQQRSRAEVYAKEVHVRYSLQITRTQQSTSPGLGLGCRPSALSAPRARQIKKLRLVQATESRRMTPAKMIPKLCLLFAVSWLNLLLVGGQPLGPQPQPNPSTLFSNTIQVIPLVLNFQTLPAPVPVSRRKSVGKGVIPKVRPLA